MNLRDLKSLNSTISEVTKPETQDKSRMIQEGFGNSLTAKARQVVDEQVEGSRGPRPMVPVMKVNPPSGNVRKEADRIKASGEEQMKKMMAKALKRAKKKARVVTEEDEINLAEVAAPGYEDWASNPKVKARFKERYGKRWKQVMYGHSWNMKEEAEAELDFAEGVDAKRMRLLRKHHVSGKPMTGKVADWMQRSFKKKLHKNKIKFGGETSAVLGKARLKYSAMKAKGLAESEQLDELSDNTLFSARWKAHQKGRTRLTGKIDNELIKRKLLAPPTTSMKERENQYVAHRDANRARLQQQGMHEESEQLDEAGYKRLMRIKKAAYKADLASRKMNPKTPKQDNQLNRLVIKHGKLGRAAAERTAQVAAGFARRGGASADAIRGGGSIIGKSGKYTQKAATLAKQRDKGLANFRNLVVDRGVSRDTGVGPVKAMGDRLKYKKPQMTPDQVAKKRKDQAAMRDFRNRARSGDFGQNNQEGMRPRYNYLKRTGKLKTK